MSGICGILRLDGAPAEGLGPMLARLERRGPDGSHAVRDGSVALGHALLATTPESLHETLPFRHPETGCTITADVRLDNREELLAALGLPTAGRVVGDGEIILHAYLRWGEACPARLLGDWAFAIWDPRDRRIFAARDPLGLKQLAYAHVPGKVFAWATEPRAVIDAPDVPRDLDEGRIADSLHRFMLERVDRESTFYRAVRRLPAAHRLSAGPQGVALARYWTLEPGPELRLPRLEDYVERVLDVLTTAVRSRLRSAGRPGAMLSGGLDSGAAAALAARVLAAEGRGPLPTFSVVGPAAEGDPETLAIRASQTIPGIEPHEIDWSDLGDGTPELLAALRRLDEPFDGVMNLPRAAYLLAQRAGVKVVLDGGGGDLVFHQGNHMTALARSGRWGALWRESVGEERFWDGAVTRRQVMSRTLRWAAVPDWMRRIRHRLRDARGGDFESDMVAPGFAKEVRLSDRVARMRAEGEAVSSLSPRYRAALVTGLAFQVGRERYERVAAGFGIEPRDPFCDLRVIDVALRCPTGVMRAGGWPKFLLRKALRGLLPDEVAWRRGRSHLGWRVTEALTSDPRFRLPDPSTASTKGQWLFERATGLGYGQIAAPQLLNSDQEALWYLALWLESERGPTLLESRVGDGA